MRNIKPPCGNCDKPQEERFNPDTFVHCRTSCELYQEYEDKKANAKQKKADFINKNRTLVTANRNFKRPDPTNTKRAVEFNQEKEKRNE